MKETPDKLSGFLLFLIAIAFGRRWAVGVGHVHGLVVHPTVLSPLSTAARGEVLCRHPQGHILLIGPFGETKREQISARPPRFWAQAAAHQPIHRPGVTVAA